MGAKILFSDVASWRFGLTLFHCLKYYLGGLFGYLQFGSSAQGNVLLNYPLTPFILTLIGLFTFDVIVSYPLANFPVRLALDYILFSTQYHERRVSKNAQIRRLWTYSFVGYVICATVGAFVTDLGTLFTITGATTNTLLSLILPPMIFLKLHKDGHVKADKDAFTSWFLQVSSWIVIIIGVVIGVAGFIIEMLSLAGVPV